MTDYYLLKKVFRSFIFTRHATPRKLINLLSAAYYHKFSKNPRIRSYPVRFVIDSGNVCNLKCPLCPTGQGKTSRNKGFMTLENFKKIIGEISPYAYEIDLYNWGEPFLNKDIFEMIRYAENSNIRVHISSNLNILPDAEQLVKSRLEQLTVSLDGASAESYSKYRKTGNFDEVIKNLKAIVAAKTRFNSKFPYITWQFLIMKHNEHEVEKAREIAKEIGVDEINFRPMRCDMGSEITMSDKEKIESTKDWLPTSEKDSRYDYSKKIRKNRLRNCLFLRTTMVINWNGSVSPCCGVYDEKWDFGNVFDTSVAEVWNNKNYLKARTAVSNKIGADKSVICSYCINNGFLEY